jgi:cytochrome c biogenesis protein CcdA
VAGRFDGGSLGSAFALGAALPLVAVAYASRAGFARARGWVMSRIETLKHGFAALLGLMGVAILLGWDKALEARIVAWLPNSWVDLTVMF